VNPIVIGMADYAVSADPEDVLVTYALGSCIALLIHDSQAGVGGLLHFMLPESKIDERKARANPSMFADTGIPMLFHRAYELGAVKSRLVVRAAGAAQVLDDAGVFNIGKRNYLALHRILWRAGVILRGEATGGTTSRTVKLEVGNGRMWCREQDHPDQQFDRSITPSKGVLECPIVS
jgi:chemotaxis protein CheD